MADNTNFPPDAGTTTYRYQKRQSHDDPAFLPFVLSIPHWRQKYAEWTAMAPQGHNPYWEAQADPPGFDMRNSSVILRKVKGEENPASKVDLAGGSFGKGMGDRGKGYFE